MDFMEAIRSRSRPKIRPNINIKTIETKRGRESIVLNGHRFTRDKTYDDRSTWRCAKRLCKVRCTTTNGQEKKLLDCNYKGQHDHEPEDEKTELITSKRQKKRRGSGLKQSTTNSSCSTGPEPGSVIVTSPQRTVPPAPSPLRLRRSPPPTMSSDLVTYTGGCHCGAVRFSVRAPAKLDIIECNCSICHKKQNFHFIVPESQFELLQGIDNLSMYTFNTHKAKHMFCKTCGVQSFYTPRSNQDGYGVAPHCLDPGSITSSSLQAFDGQNWEESFAKSNITKYSKDPTAS